MSAIDPVDQLEQTNAKLRRRLRRMSKAYEGLAVQIRFLAMAAAEGGRELDAEESIKLCEKYGNMSDREVLSVILAGLRDEPDPAPAASESLARDSRLVEELAEADRKFPKGSQVARRRDGQIAATYRVMGRHVAHNGVACLDVHQFETGARSYLPACLFERVAEEE